jgi:hypothetical protein
MRKLIVAFLLAACLSASVSAQTGILPERFGKWVADSPARSLTVKDLGTNWAQGGNADAVLQECGLGGIEQRTYQNGPDEVTLRVLRFHDPSSAYEFYTFSLAPGMRNLGVGADSALGQTDGRILVGNLVLQATLSPNTKPESLNELAAALKSKADSSPLPPLKSYLPATWRVFGSEKYALGPQGFRAAMSSLNEGAYADLSDEIGFLKEKDSAEAILAQYQGQHGSGVLLLLEYPTPQVAERRKHHLEQALPGAAKETQVTIERKASLLSLVFAATSPIHAQAIRDEVNYETQVTWDEPHQTYSDPPLVRVLYKIFLFTSLFVVFATMTGIAFGGFRILVKHWWPGKVFDRPENIEVIQLGLSGKKIDPSDMY